MHTLLIGKDNSIITTNAERIIQRSKGANIIRFLVDQEYNGTYMNECMAIMYYKLPVSGEWKSKELVPSAELWKEKYVEYQFIADTWLTSERGDVEIIVKFYKVAMSGELDINQYVRKAIDGKIHISSSEDWASGVADSLMDSLDQRIIQMMMLQERQNEMIEEAQYSSAASLGVTGGKIHLVDAGGAQKGDAVDVVMPRTVDNDGRNGDGVIELGEVIHDDSDPDCDCGCDHENFEELDSYIATEPDNGIGNFSEL